MMTASSEFITKPSISWHCFRFLSTFVFINLGCALNSVGLRFCSCNENIKLSVIWYLDVSVYVPSKDSGQAIPRVVESCIRYINLYGKSVAMWRVENLSLDSAQKSTVIISVRGCVHTAGLNAQFRINARIRFVFVWLFKLHLQPVCCMLCDQLTVAVEHSSCHEQNCDYRR